MGPIIGKKLGRNEGPKEAEELPFAEKKLFATAPKGEEEEKGPACPRRCLLQRGAEPRSDDAAEPSSQLQDGDAFDNRANNDGGGGVSGRSEGGNAFPIKSKITRQKSNAERHGIEVPMDHLVPVHKPPEYHKWRKPPPGAEHVDAGRFATKHYHSHYMATASPLLRGKYEEQIFEKLMDLHRDGYMAKHIPPKLQQTKEFEIVPPEVEGLHVSQRGTVGDNLVYPPMDRVVQLDQRQLRIARHKASRVMLHFEAKMAQKTAGGPGLAGGSAHVLRQRQRQGDGPRPRGADRAAARRPGRRGDQRLRAQFKYDACVEHCKQALKFYKALEKLTHLDRNLSPQETTRREADKRRFKAFVHPRKTVVKFALHDGRTARDLAAQRLEARDYDAAVEFLNDAEACFRWTGTAARCRPLRSSGKPSTSGALHY